jgi:hypothetical protein
MTLALDKWLVNLIYKECKIAHREVTIWGGKTDKIRSSIKQKITLEYGETSLDDANYVLFFKGPLLNEADGIKKLFQTVNVALGKNANSLSMSDFKKIKSAANYDAADVVSDEIANNESILDFVFVKITLK